MTVSFGYLPLEEALSLELELSIVCSSQDVFSRVIITCVGYVATPVEIPGQFRNNQSLFGTIWAKAGFWDPSGIHVRNPGLSRLQDSWQLYLL